MSQNDDLLDVRSHFAFGENWASYAKGIGERQVNEAIEGLRRLCGDEVAGRRFLDIGCGSGIHSLSALELGAGEVTAVDLDVRSVETTRVLLGASNKSGKWSADVCSVFDLGTRYPQEFDVVYSWGVLHHTGDLDRAMRAAAQRVTRSGLFCFALYRRTWLCPLWKLEKRWYANASARGQNVAKAIYKLVLACGLAIRGRSLKSYIKNYQLNHRGMDFWHDLHDWLGGYPYESISPKDVQRLMDSLGFLRVREFVKRRRPIGLLGSGCDEYVYRRV